MKRGKKLLIIGSIVVVVVVAGIFTRNYLRTRFAMNARLNQDNLASAKVTRGDLKVSVDGSGKAEFSEKKDIIAKLDGEVLKVNAKDGDQIKKDDPIAEIDMEDAVATAENDIRQMESKIKLQEVTVREQSDNLTDLQDIKEQCDITAPYTGILSELTVKEGDSINKDQRIGTIDDTSQLRITLPFEKTQAEKVKSGQAVDVYLTDYIDKDVKARGKIASISNTSNGDQAITNIKVALEGKEGYEAGANASFSLMVNGTTVAPLSTGKLEWIDSHSFTSMESGKTKEVLKEAGDEVTQGEVLVRLENENVGSDIQKARTNLESAQIDLDQLKDQLEQARKNLEELKANSLLTAPMDGVVSGLAIEAGGQLKAGTVVAVVSDASKLVVPVYIDELDISKVKTGQTVEITLDALEGQTFAGTVDEVAVEGTNENGIGSFEVTVAVSDSENIKPGMSANVEILVSEKKDTLILPIEAVRKSDDQYMVMLKSGNEEAGTTNMPDKNAFNREPSVNGETGNGELPGNRETDSGETETGQPDGDMKTDGKAASDRKTGSSQQTGAPASSNLVTVKLGLVSDTYVEILEGLEEGDEVLISGQNGNSMQFGMPGGMNGGQQQIQQGSRGEVTETRTYRTEEVSPPDNR